MSTGYRPLRKVSAYSLFNGCLEAFGVREHVKSDDVAQTSRCLTDGRNYLWVYIDDDGFVGCLSRYGCNAPGKILSAVAEAFDTDIVSEYEPQFWGFDTQEEGDAYQARIAKENREKFDLELLKYLRNEPNDIRPGTIGMIEAQIAKKLVESDPGLLLPENWDKLRHDIRSIYERDHTVTVTLTPEQKAFAKMIATHEDDLPHA